MKFFFQTGSAQQAAALLGIFLITSCKSDILKESAKANSGEETTLTAADPLMKLLSPEESGLKFQNQIVETFENNITNNINIYNGGGVGVGDFNNDGQQDIYLISCTGKNGLFLNKGGMKFEDATDAAGLGNDEGFETAATVVDINGDGWQDIYVCRAGVIFDDSRRNKLYVNNGDAASKGGKPTFSEQAKAYGLDDISASTGANFFDADLDGDLDLYLLNYPQNAGWTARIESQKRPDGSYEPYLQPDEPYDSDRFYRNDGGKFADISKQAGIWNLGFGLSVSVSDINRDGFPDVYVANDFVQPDQIYINSGKTSGGAIAFENRVSSHLRHSSQHSMGSDLTDFDNDGLVDIFVADMLPRSNQRQKLTANTNGQAKYTAMLKGGYFPPTVRNVLQRNNGNGTFSDVACLTGLYNTDWSWSGLFFDMDNNGIRDLHITNGYRRETTNRDFIDFIMPEVQKTHAAGKKLREMFPTIEDFLERIPVYKVRNFVFQNKGDWAFEEVSGKWMTMKPSWSCGSAYADFDNDGDLDLVINNLDETPFLYENKTAGKPNSNYLQVKFRGSPLNRDGVGATVMVWQSGGKVQYLENFPVRGIFSSVENLLHFGLGGETSVQKLTVRWPDGKTQTLTQVPANQRLTLDYANASGYVACLQPDLPTATIFKDLTPTAGLNFRHAENEFNDFEQWPMNPWKTTDLGPNMAVGDVNGDGLDDVFLPNAAGVAAGMYAQQANATFRSLSPAVWEADKQFESLGAVFIDIDKDKDLDLFVLGGGMENEDGNARQNRLYINADGKGTFQKLAGGLPGNADLGIRAWAQDLDQDGDQDLIVGGRLVPGKWPLTPRSMILRNDGNKFTDVTAAAPDFEKCGMISDLMMVNLDADPIAELVVVGEFMPVTIFKSVGGRLTNMTNQFGFGKSNGLWNRLAVADLDRDGDNDLVTANLGLNTRFTASPEAPFKCYAKDFDNNGILDPVMTIFEGGKEFPLVQKEVLNKQIPILKKKLLYAKDYAVAGIEDVWPREVLNAALNLSAYTLETCWWENRKGVFVQRSLPIQAQMSVNQGIAIDDFNSDGHLDILLAGNKNGFEVETNQCDSGNGTLLLGDGHGNFRFMENLAHGFWATRQARDLALLRGPGGKKLIVVSNNNDAPKVFLKL